jgi:two-component system, LytTR family, sensor kinase
MTDKRWRPSVRWVLHIVLFNEALAVPIALMTAASGAEWIKSFIGASTYTQTIGSLCFLGGALMTGRCETLLGPARLALSLVVNLVLAVIGGALANALLTSVFGYSLSRHSMLLNLATGASIAMLVSVGKMTSHQLRIALEISEQSLRERELASERLLKAKSEAELAALQARINPHFLFNTLNSIAALIGDDPTKAEQVLGQLSSLMRYTLQSNRCGVASVEDELTIVRGYLEIEEVRLGDRLHYEIDVDPAVRGAELPVLLLQPLVENAIKHGIAPKVAGGRVALRGWREADFAIFTIADDGDGGGRDTTGTGEGLANVRQRLDALYGDRASVTLTRENGCTETRVVLPFVQGPVSLAQGTAGAAGAVRPASGAIAPGAASATGTARAAGTAGAASVAGNAGATGSTAGAAGAAAAGEPGAPFPGPAAR